MMSVPKMFERLVAAMEDIHAIAIVGQDASVSVDEHRALASCMNDAFVSAQSLLVSIQSQIDEAV